MTIDELNTAGELASRIISVTEAFFAERGTKYDHCHRPVVLEAMNLVVIGLLNIADDPSERREALENFTDALYSLTAGDSALRQGWLPPKRPD
jgi:hypothetical protein